MQQGYVYVLTNYAHYGKVKIGKTVRDPRERAAELSSGSGVIGHFAVHYSIQRRDIDHAEALIHHALKNSRFQGNREFFKTSTNNAVDVVNKCVALVDNIDNEILQDELQPSVERLEKSNYNTRSMERAQFSHKTMGSRSSPIGTNVPFNFHTQKVVVKCTRCMNEFSQTLVRTSLFTMA